MDPDLIDDVMPGSGHDELPASVSVERVSLLPPPPGRPSGQPRRRPSGQPLSQLGMGIFYGMMLSAVLVALGYALAAIYFDDSQPVATTGPAIPAPVLATGGLPSTPVALDGDMEPVAAAAQAVAPSVVRIESEQGQGSGIVWDSDNGYIVTNQHVVGSTSLLTVQFDDSLELEGTVIGGDAARDVAVVRVDPAGLNLVQAEFAPDESVRVGQLAVAVGHPFGLNLSVTAGIVSVVDWINRAGGSDSTANPVPVRMIQTDAPINPGNSGGALADREGRVIGMNTSIFNDGRSRDNAGVGFAVPSDTVDLIARRIVNDESLELGFLGIQGATLTDGTVGAKVEELVDGGPAERAGLEVGDLIRAVDGERVESMEELSADIKLYRPGDVIDVEVLRDGSRMELQIVVGSYNA